jgi:hypothetical protein
MTRNGQVRYELKTPWRNGTTHVIFERKGAQKRGRIHFSRKGAGYIFLKMYPAPFLQAEDAIGRKPSKLMFILAFQG